MGAGAEGRSIGLNHAEIAFSDTLKGMARHWAATSPFWKDEARAEFQKAFVDDLLASTRDALNAMDQIQRLLGRVIQECG